MYEFDVIENEEEKKKQYIGQRLKWKDVVEIFPDRWVLVTDFTKPEGGAGIDEGVLLAVCYDRDRGKHSELVHETKAAGKKCYWKRTTEIHGVNALWTMD